MFGGSNADIKNHPYVAELLAKSIDDEPFCGGTLIAPQYVLTAVSCLAWLPFDMHVSLGGQKNKGRSSRKAEQIRVVETYRHPVFNSTWLPYDVALLKLKKPSTHKPARLCDADGSDNKPGTMASVFGWGDVSEKALLKLFNRSMSRLSPMTSVASMPETPISRSVPLGRVFATATPADPLLPMAWSWAHASHLCFLAMLVIAESTFVVRARAPRD
ncbi:hypothetical protein PC129_g4489 [Phytophthora cactorum]|uniref:Peptidase S1 domain-containing protein n=1 Tax=Phytophthora cactorum TaxID=29920 RepID=A0A329SM59_9STRA|nr:hypothetical protein Pcac1_g8287 [Phytophthora cactorum]KAG2833473.1 hypothetical protein PC112_g6481 [Phytophthora cactorum]KAG2836006.1 hypothetical protein PC111_g5205 [Phytophthora cactorum]KAG2862110.1 hypothetical protein PC113_g6616 [Phytophthora cactorum]KAG2891944.1 hypothetical protein PC114_g16797 [Phytophthora cactorum]